MAKHIQQMELLFKALADATRLRILGLLLTGEVCVCHIHESLKIPQPKASRHLAYLRRSGLVTTRRDGLWIYYRLAESAEPPVGAISDALRSALVHTDVVRRDADRLQQRNGRCLPPPASVGVSAARQARQMKKKATNGAAAR
jgi:ArsR family transcriptional regulator